VLAVKDTRKKHFPNEKKYSAVKSGDWRGHFLL
jgi:hypothetical protein